jgi:hypothetical protein
VNFTLKSAHARAQNRLLLQYLIKLPACSLPWSQLGLQNTLHQRAVETCTNATVYLQTWISRRRFSMFIRHCCSSSLYISFSCLISSSSIVAEKLLGSDPDDAPTAAALAPSFRLAINLSLPYTEKYRCLFFWPTVTVTKKICRNCFKNVNILNNDTAICWKSILTGSSKMSECIENEVIIISVSIFSSGSKWHMWFAVRTEKPTMWWPYRIWVCKAFSNVLVI